MRSFTPKTRNMFSRIAALREMTVARGCTVHEAAAAKKILDELLARVKTSGQAESPTESRARQWDAAKARAEADVQWDKAQAKARTEADAWDKAQAKARAEADAQRAEVRRAKARAEADARRAEAWARDAEMRAQQARAEEARRATAREAERLFQEAKVEAERERAERLFQEAKAKAEREREEAAARAEREDERKNRFSRMEESRLVREMRETEARQKREAAARAERETRQQVHHAASEETKRRALERSPFLVREGEAFCPKCDSGYNLKEPLEITYESDDKSAIRYVCTSCHSEFKLIKANAAGDAWMYYEIQKAGHHRYRR